MIYITGVQLSLAESRLTAATRDKKLRANNISLIVNKRPTRRIINSLCMISVFLRVFNFNHTLLIILPRVIILMQPSSN